ncbi:cysteine hydrolase [Streptomyces sp. WAC 00631]|uniref:cysteine hydrolase family protein n=1 Tax=unclassified Streptomyces TaxID=2593676 RepID=UPI000F7AF6DB|nr:MULTISPECIES: isochorismatase family cysteine hydrolase [unclassified Streptomyces]MCC5033735.1 cysteine hydrolase [Streptomyces sp. WAC 00631]MCC9742875.1 cysteine hydrolase [Streptomyces sp. MNU89]
MRKSALVVIDMVNTYDHPDADRLISSVRETLPAMRELIERARNEDVDVIYVNDNFGRWRSHHDEILDTALSGPYADLVEPVRPDERSLFVLKARHSVFFQTPLEYLLTQYGIGRIVLCGQVTEQCVLYSALDAHIRHLTVAVPRDAVAHIHPDLADAALRMMERNMGAEICDAASVRF